MSSFNVTSFKYKSQALHNTIMSQAFSTCCLLVGIETNLKINVNKQMQTDKKKTF